MTEVAAAKLQIEECKGDFRPSGFRDWTYDRCYEFMTTWDRYESEGHGEQAALALTCEGWEVSYMDTEWIQIVEAVANRSKPNGKDPT